MKIMPDGSVISDDGIYLGRASAEDVQDYESKGILERNADGGYNRISNSDHTCNCGCGRPISAFTDFFSGGSAGATPECRKRIKESLPRAKQYLAENNLTVPGPNGGWMTPEDAAKRK